MSNLKAAILLGTIAVVGFLFFLWLIRWVG